MPLLQQRTNLEKIGFRTLSETDDTLVAVRTRFHWDCVLTFVTYIAVVRRVPGLTADMIRSDRKQFQRRARKLDPNFLPRGMQKGRALILAYVADHATAEARALCDEPTFPRFAAIFVPAVLDLKAQHAHYYRGIRIWGGIYQSKLCFLVGRILEPDLTAHTWPISLGGAFLTLLLTLICLLLIPASIGLRLGWTSASAVSGTSGATDLFSAGAGFCVTTPQEVRCWESGGRGSSREAKAVRGLSHPRTVAMTLNETCALDDDGVKCWSRYSQDPPQLVPGLAGATELIAAADNFCALTRDEVRCWRDRKTPAESMVGLRRPTHLVPSLFQYSFCALDEQGLKCFRYYANETPPFYQPTFWLTGFNKALAVSANEWANRVVVLDQGRLLSYYDIAGSMLNTRSIQRKRGFDRPVSLKPMAGFRNPKALIEYSIHTYALDDDGLKSVDPGGTQEEGELGIPGGTRIHMDRGGTLNAIPQAGPEGPTAIWSGPDSYVYSRDEKGQTVLRCSGWRKGKRDVFVVHGVRDPKKVARSLYEACALDGTEVKCWKLPSQ
ncbi:MAG: hypothetical protein HY898_08185 [Deltaproteobacteria bacterium]|nr:hypothetical protein [Deltaproteobacteria bacterium]